MCCTDARGARRDRSVLRRRSMLMVRSHLGRRFSFAAELRNSKVWMKAAIGHDDPAADRQQRPAGALVHGKWQIDKWPE
jgi:hypothetical protein